MTLKTYTARFLHGRTGGEGNYAFEGPSILMQASPVRIMRHCMERITERKLIEHEDYEIFTALKDDEHKVITVTGKFIYTGGSSSPFMCMIAAKD